MRELEDDDLKIINNDDNLLSGLNEQNINQNPEPESPFKDLPRSLEILRDKSLTSPSRYNKTSDISNILKAFDEVEKAKEEIQKAADERVNKLGKMEDAPDKRAYRRKLKEKKQITVAERNYLLDLLAKVVTVINSERSRDDKKKLTPEQQQALEMIKMYTGHQLIALYGAQPIYMPTLHQLRLRAENSLEKILNSHKEDEPEEEGILDRLLNSDPSTSEWKETQKEIAEARNEFERRGGYKEKDPEPEEEEPKPEEKPEDEEKLEGEEKPGNEEKQQEGIIKPEESLIEGQLQGEPKPEDQKQEEPKSDEPKAGEPKAKEENKEEQKEENKEEQKDREKQEENQDQKQEDPDNKKDESLEEYINRKKREENENADREEAGNNGNGKKEDKEELAEEKITAPPLKLDFEHPEVIGDDGFDSLTSDNRPVTEAYREFDFSSGHLYIGTALFGLMNDVLSKRRMDELYRKVAFIGLGRGIPQELAAAYPEYREALGSIRSKNYVTVDETVPDRYDHNKAEISKFVSPAFDKPLKDFREGMREIVAEMDKKAKNTVFKTPDEEDYFLFMKGMMEDLAEGRFTDKYMNYPGYQYAANILGKINLTSAMALPDEQDPRKLVVTYNSGEKASDKKIIDDLANIRRIHDSGIIAAIAQCKKVIDMENEHLRTGDTTRDELLAGYMKQERALQKALNMTKEDYDRMQKGKVFQNKWEEYVSGQNRGYTLVLKDAQARISLLKAGYPVSDLTPMAYFARAIYHTESRAEELERDINFLRNKKEPNEQDRSKLEGYLVEQQEIQGALAEMRAAWDDAVKVKNLTPAQRVQKLSGLNNCLAGVRDKYKNVIIRDIKVSAYQLNKHMQDNMQLSAYDRARMTENVTTLYKYLDKVDKKVISSSWFSDMKDELSELARMQQRLARVQETYDGLQNPTAEELSELQKIRNEYSDQLEATLKSVNNYLRFKTKQMNDPKKKHTRSEKEARRVRMADAIFSSLMNQRFPGTDELVRSENFEAICMETGKESILSNERDKNRPVGYDSYIRLHTGRAVINGTKNELIDDLSKALAAHALQKDKKPFDVDKIHKYASQLKENFDFDNSTREKLASYLQDPKKIGRVSWNITQTAYGITNNVSYETYLNRMRKLYKQLLEPTKNDSYRKIYDAVEKAAHLPEDLTHIDRNKLHETIAHLNYDIMRLSKKYVLDNCKNFSNRSYLAGRTGEAMDAYCTVASVTKGAEYLPERLAARVNEKRGTVTFNSDDDALNLVAREHIYADQYGHRKLSDTVKRDLDPEKLDDMKRKIKVPDNDILKNAKEEIRNTGREIAEEKQKNNPEKKQAKNPEKKQGLALDENADGEKKPKRRNSISYKK